MEKFGDYVYPFAVSTQPNERFAVITQTFSMVGSDSQSKTYTLSYGYDFVMAMINSYSTSTFRMNINDVFRSENLFFQDTRGSVVTGNGQNSFILPKMHKFNRGNSITINITDLSGAANTVEISLIGYKIVNFSPELEISAEDINAPASMQGMQGFSMAHRGMERYGQDQSANQQLIPPQQYVIDRFFGVPFDFNMAGSTYSLKFPVSTGFDFMWEVLNSFSAREFTLQIKDEFVTEDFFTSPIHSSSITGTGSLPFIMPRPYIFRGGTYITVTIDDTDAQGSTTPVQVALIGYKVRRVS